MPFICFSNVWDHLCSLIYQELRNLHAYWQKWNPELNRSKCKPTLKDYKKNSSNIWDQTKPLRQKYLFKRNIQSLHLHIPERCGKRYSSCCESHPADCKRIQQRLQPAEGWGDTHSDTSEGNCHCRGKKQPIRLWTKHVKLNVMVLCGSCLPITLWAWVAECLISAPDGDGATPSHDHSHDTVDQGVDKLTRMEQLTQQGNFRACNSWDDWRKHEKTRVSTND